MFNVQDKLSELYLDLSRRFDGIISVLYRGCFLNLSGILIYMGGGGVREERMW